VSIEIILSKEVYKDNVINQDLLRKRVIDLAYTNPGLIFYFNKEKYVYKKGLYQLAERLDKKTSTLLGEESFVYKGKNQKGKNFKAKFDISISLCMDYNSEDREKFISFVNSTPTYDGGFHHDRFRRLFINIIKDKLDREAKREKITIGDNDVLMGMSFVIGITMPNPRFESQTKRKLVKDAYLDKFLESFMNKYMRKFIKDKTEFLEVVIDRAKSRHKFQELKDASKRGKIQKKQRVQKLLDANERKNREDCVLFICEGDSAIGGLRSARNKLIQGGIALKGKPLNVSQATINDILKNQELSDIMASIGLTLGQPADFDRMRYSKVVFLADSDVDGGHINTLLTNFFFRYWPELFKAGAIQIAKAPLYEVITDNGKMYAETPNELEKIKAGKYKIKEIQRNKGLGEMSPDAWKYVLSRPKFTQITVDDVKASQNMLDICFGKESGPRKDLLIDDSSVNVSLTASGAKKAAASSAKKFKKQQNLRKKSKR